MSHDTEAAYASSEVAGLLMNEPNLFFGNYGHGAPWSVYAGREGGYKWPLADGVILAENTSVEPIKIAFEFKRLNEGVHGILTALGQSLAYLEKGYNASIMVIPARYSSHASPGNHIKNVIDSTAPDIPVSIYTYESPDLSATRPFHEKLQCVRRISYLQCRKIQTNVTPANNVSVTTLWAHMREGMSHPDAFFRYCQAVKVISSTGENLNGIRIPTELLDAVHRIKPNQDAFKYLSNTSGDTIADKAWRYTWFNYYFWNDLMPLYSSTSPYVVNNTQTRIRINEHELQNIFTGRTDSIKSKLVAKLNDPTNPMSREEAWMAYAKKVRNDAHSYREVIDSGLYHIGYLSPEGTLTELGYKYVEACERIGSATTGIPIEILRASILQNGQYGALLHYIYKLSEEKFSDDLFAFATRTPQGGYTFDNTSYIDWIDDIFVNSLHISKKSTVRAGSTRRPLQAELACLKKFGFVKTNSRNIAYRVGVGLEIDWPQVQNSMLFFQSLK